MIKPKSIAQRSRPQDLISTNELHDFVKARPPLQSLSPTQEPDWVLFPLWPKGSSLDFGSHLDPFEIHMEAEGWPILFSRAKPSGEPYWHFKYNETRAMYCQIQAARALPIDLLKKVVKQTQPVLSVPSISSAGALPWDTKYGCWYVLLHA